MKIYNNQTTYIEAEEGKVLQRISSGVIWGKRVNLGYNYYEAGIALSTPILLTPDDFREIDEPEGWEDNTFDPNTFVDPIAVMKQTASIFHQRVGEAASLDLTNRQKHELKSAHAVWGIDMDEDTIKTFEALNVKVIKVNDTVTLNTTFIYKGDIFMSLSEHQVRSHYVPGPTTLALYRIVPEQDGTLDDPIEYKQGMMADLGEFFLEDGVKYECIRTYDGSTAHMPSEMVNDYFKVVEDVPAEEEGGTNEEGGTTAELGTAGNPIPYVPLDLIPLEAGLYYTQDGVKYYCHTAAAATGHNLSALVPNHVQVVEQ